MEIMSVIKFGKDLPTFVRRFREEMRWSQSDMGYFMGVHGQYVSNVERGVCKSHAAFAARMMPLIDPDRRPYLMDLIEVEASEKAVQRVKRATSKFPVIRRKAR